MRLDLDGLAEDLKTGRLKDDRETAAALFYALGALMDGASEEQRRDMATARRLWRPRGEDAGKAALREKYNTLIRRNNYRIDAGSAGVNRIIFAILHNNDGVTPECLDAVLEIGHCIGAAEGDVDAIIVKHVPGASKFLAAQ